jgi:hypothetical protein
MPKFDVAAVSSMAALLHFPARTVVVEFFLQMKLKKEAQNRLLRPLHLTGDRS